MAASKRHWAAFATTMTVAACGAAWLASSWDDVKRGNGVIVHRETKSPEEIRKYWTPERIRRAEPAEMPVWNPCEHFPSLLSPDCW
ncbi:hypothetical protein ABZ078_05890 [Streptomyces sp. NPDC006385]|uniref:hypothetical protein n=1 Tax=Streptomyces sp. NPDC006385 TaxID=3156761 RepID=UPI0033B20A50